MLVVLASRGDAAAASLVQRWRERDAKLLTCEGLSRRGWTFTPDAPQRSTLVLDGERVPVGALRGWVTLLAGVDGNELPHIAPDDRPYIASEMMAFLVAWLSALPCPVVNRPSPLCLTGPRLYPEQWLRAAARVGLDVEGFERTAARFGEELRGPELPVPSVLLPVVDGRCIGGHDVSDELRAGVERLASEVEAGLLTAQLARIDDRLRFVGAVPLVDVSRADVADALLDALGGST